MAFLFGGSSASIAGKSPPCILVSYVWSQTELGYLFLCIVGILELKASNANLHLSEILWLKMLNFRFRHKLLRLNLESGLKLAPLCSYVSLEMVFRRHAAVIAMRERCCHLTLADMRKLLLHLLHDISKLQTLHLVLMQV